ncbi:hypothetical protein C8R43DRAFT_1235336 [Mycena crocata]|nr:hypothetical protein C8R43DRAFT_1235336 [Mycena crocata]
MPLQDLPAGFIELNDTILSRNHLPTEEQVPELKAQLELGKADLIDLEDEFVQASLALADVTARRAARRKQVRALSAVLAPIRRIPPELLAEIFGHCVRASEESIKSCRAAPLLLGRICSHFGVPSYFHAPSCGTISASAPLSLYISAQHRDFKDAVLPIQSRLRELSLHLNIRGGPPLAVTPHRFPILHKLDITLDFNWAMNDQVATEHISAVLPLFADSPQLSEFGIEIVGVYGRSSLPALDDRFPYAWPQLTRLTIRTPMNISWIRGLLLLCSGLEVLNIHCYGGGGTFVCTQDPIIVLGPRLHSLTFGTDKHAGLLCFFTTFSFPGLATLDIRLNDSVESEFIPVAHCTLKHLTLHSITFLRPELLVAYLASLPLITSLSFDDCTLHDTFFAALNRHTTTTSFLPLLDTLHIDASNIEGTVLADMLGRELTPKRLQTDFRSLY